MATDNSCRAQETVGKKMTKEKLLQFLNYVGKVAKTSGSAPCITKCPSEHWKDVASSFKNGGKEKKKAVSQSFKRPGECNETTVMGFGNKTKQSKRTARGEPCARGTEIHKWLAKSLQKREEGTRLEDFTQGELQVREVIESIEKKFGLQIVWSEKQISAFAQYENRSDQWRGQFDAIGITSNGEVIVIEWRTCDNINYFWNNASEYKEKLYQSIMYRELLTANLRDYFQEEIPAPGIMIVAIDRENLLNNDPRLCLDFTKIEEAGILDSVKKLLWHVKPCNSYSQNGSRCQKVHENLKPHKPPLDSFDIRQREVDKMGEGQKSDLLATFLTLFDLLGRKDFSIDDLSKEEKEKFINAFTLMPRKAAVLHSRLLPQLTSLPSKPDEDLLQVRLRKVFKYGKESTIKSESGRDTGKKRPSSESIPELWNPKFQKLSQDSENRSQKQSDALTGKDHTIKNIKSGFEGSQTVGAHPIMDGNKPSVKLTSLTSGRRNLSHGHQEQTGLTEKIVESLLKEWICLCCQPEAGKESEKAFTTFVEPLCQHGILQKDGLMKKFLCISTRLTVETYKNKGLHDPSLAIERAKYVYTVDFYCRLLVLFVRYQGDVSHTKIFNTVAEVLIEDHKADQPKFKQEPYYLIFNTLLAKLNQVEPILDANHVQFPVTFGMVFYSLRPSSVSQFANAWLKLISQPFFLSKLLNNKKSWSLVHLLLTDLFRLLEADQDQLYNMENVVKETTYRVLLDLFYTFPEFLSCHHQGFCDVIPPDCIQMRNVIFGAFERNAKISNPFMQNLLSYLEIRAPVTFLTELKTHLKVSSKPGTGYSEPLMNTLVLCVGRRAIMYLDSDTARKSSTFADSSFMDIFQTLAVELDTEGRNLFLNTIVNQCMRGKNSHTSFFGSILLHLFCRAKTEAFRKDITRVLSERLIGSKPHPSGLIKIFNEFRSRIKDMCLTYFSPEIKELLDFEAVSTSVEW